MTAQRRSPRSTTSRHCLAQATALNRIGEPGDIGSAIAFLASDAASWVTGETMVIDGGQRLGDAAQFRTGPVADG